MTKKNKNPIVCRTCKKEIFGKDELGIHWSETTHPVYDFMNAVITLGDSK